MRHSANHATQNGPPCLAHGGLFWCGHGGEMSGPVVIQLKSGRAWYGVALAAILTGCPAPPLPTTSERGEPVPPDGGTPRDAGERHQPPYGRPAGRHRPTATPTFARPDDAHTGGAGPVTREFCDGVDNDGDGAVDERVRNACAECGPTPDDVANATDDDCDGTIDEGHIAAPCGGDADCLDPLSCQDGRCGIGCAPECEACVECVREWHASDGQPLILLDGCEGACAVCDGRCAALGAICHRGQCARDADAVGCLAGQSADVAEFEWYADGGVWIRYAAACVE